VDAATVADVLDEMGLHDQGLSPDFRALSGTRLVGRAYTIRGRSAPAPSGGDPRKMEACGGVSADEIAVWSGDGYGIAYFGELIARGMAERGCVGALVQGAARDLRWLEEMGFPVFGTFRTPVQSIGRWSVEDWQVPVQLPGATTPTVEVRPGDLVVADEDGAVVVPAERAQAVLERTEELTATEVRIRADIAVGSTLAQALEKYGHV
jgi:regulator of RNase E activity RraA